jgi:conjugal transfer ATP-binding protein TraC
MWEAFKEMVLRWGASLFQHFILPFKRLGNNAQLRLENIQSFLEYKSVSEYLNYAYAIEKDGDTVYALKDGSFGIVLRVNLPTFPNQTVETQIGSFLKTVTEEIDVITFNTFASQNLEHQLKAFLDNHPCEPNIKHRGFLKKLLIRRYEFLKKATRTSLFDRLDFRLRNYVSTISIIFNPSLSEDDCFSRIDVIKGALSKFHPSSLPVDQFVALQREFFFHNKDASFWNDSSDHVVELARQVTRGGLKVDVADERHKNGFVINDETFVSVLTTKKFPMTIDFEDTDACFMDRRGMNIQPHIKGPFYTSLVLDYRDLDAVKKKIMNDAQSNFNETSKIRTKDLKKNPHLKRRKVEAEQVIDTLNSSRERPVPGQWSLVMWDDDLKKLNQSISSIRNSFQHKGWELIPEVFGHVAFLNALHSLPLQLNIVVDQFLQRKEILFDISNHVPIVPWLGESTGVSNNPHIPWFSRTGQLQWFDPFDNDTNFNIACSGDSGSGKSYTVNDLITMSLAQNYVVRMIDNLPSYKEIAYSLGGQYEDFSNSKFCMNFFTHIIEKEDEDTGEPVRYVSSDGQTYTHISDEDYSVIIPIVGSMMGLVLTSTKSTKSSSRDSMLESHMTSLIENAIRASYEARGREAGMKEVYEYVVKEFERERAEGSDEIKTDLYRAVKSLARFGAEDGPYFSYFNGPNNLEVVGDFSVYEMQKLKGKGILYPLTLMSIANRLATEFFDMDHATQKKILAMDEFHEYIEMDIVLNFSNELARKVRKAGGLFMPITQGISDYFRNPEMKAIYANSGWQFLLKNKPISIDHAIASKELSVSSYVANMLKEINPKKGLYGEFCIMEGSNIQFSRLKVDGVSHYLYTTDSGDKLKIQKIAEEKGISFQDAIAYIGIQRDEPEWDDERILLEIGAINEEEVRNNKEMREQREHDIEAAIEKVVELSNYIISTREIYNKENQVAMKMLEFGIKSPKHELYNFNDYASTMLEMENDSDMLIQMLEKSLLPEYAEDNILIPVPLDTLLSNRLYQFARDSFEMNKYKRHTFVVDVSLTDEYDTDEIKASLDNWRELGFSISIKRYSYMVNNALALDITPGFTVIDAHNFSNNEEELDNSVRFAKVFSSDIVLLNSESYSLFKIEGLDISYKDTVFEFVSEELSDAGNLGIMETIDAI